MKFSDKLVNLRKRNNLSQEQLADKLGVSRQSVSKWELGDTYPDMAKLIQMCEILNCTLPELMDDGTFPEDYSMSKEKNNSFSSYMNNFLDYVTKTYNMFIHMSIKSKLVCFIEMLCIFGVLALIAVLAPELLDAIFSKVFRYIPYGRNIANILVDICTVIIIIIEVVVFLHLFKIRYLDYYVTITDNTIKQQIIEEPIDENKNESAFEEKNKKEKLVIRDPKHSISHFLEGVGKVLLFFLKLFIVLCMIPAIIIALGGVYLAVIMIANVAFSSLFLYGFITMVAVTVIGLLLVYMAFNYLFKRKQPYRIIVIVFIISLITIGIGCGLATNKALQFNVVDGNYQSNTSYNQETIQINQEDIVNDYRLDIGTYMENIEVEINDDIKGINVVIDKPNYVSVYSETYWEDADEYNEQRQARARYFYFSSNQSMGEIFLDIKEDIKNGYLRRSYDNPCDLVKVKLIMSQETENKISISSW